MRIYANYKGQNDYIVAARFWVNLGLNLLT